MKEIVLAFIKFAQKKGLGELCLLVAVLAMFLSMVSAAGWHPLDFGLTKHGPVQDAHAESHTP